jgi:lipopolysaccharide export system protein LptA
MRWTGAAVLGLSLAALPADARAQAVRQSCDLLPDPPVREANQVVTPLGEIVYISGPARFRCTGGVDVLADSVIFNRAAGELRLIGNAEYRDPEKTLSSDWLTYLGREGRLLGRGNVVLTDRTDGSIITGTEMEHLRSSPERPEAVTVVTGHPHAVLRPRGEAADTAPPFDVFADRLTLVGEISFQAEGNVRIVRGELRAFARRADYAPERDRLLLQGDARVEGDEFQLHGERIEALLDGERLREVYAETEASVLARELRVTAPRVRLYLLAGAFERLIARGGMDGLPQAVATTPEFRLEADSIDALAPAERLREVIAIGAAYGERLEAARIAGLHPLVSRDWLRGDTIRGYFVDVPAQTEDAAPSSELERLVASAGADPASSLYRMPDERDPSGRPQVNYLLAATITLHLRSGEVRDVRATGPIRGVHLQPEGARPAPEPQEGVEP